jgi:hypothetical protein
MDGVEHCKRRSTDRSVGAIPSLSLFGFGQHGDDVGDFSVGFFSTTERAERRNLKMGTNYLSFSM